MHDCPVSLDGRAIGKRDVAHDRGEVEINVGHDTNPFVKRVLEYLDS